MSESNKAVLRRWIEECFNQRRVEVTDELIAENHVFHEPSGGAISGRATLKQAAVIDWLAAFPDLRCTVEAQFAEGDTVVTHWRWCGTHAGEFLGIPPTRKKVDVESIIICRIAGGVIEETWEVWDAYGFHRQLGVTSASAEANKNLVRRYMEEVWNQGKVEVVGEIFTADSYFRALHSGEFRGLEARKEFVTGLRTAFPDTHYTIDDLMAEGDKVTLRWSHEGTHRGEWFGIIPSGKVIRTSGTSTFRFSESKIQEELVQWDSLGYMQQLGVVPLPGA